MIDFINPFVLGLIILLIILILLPTILVVYRFKINSRLRREKKYSSFIICDNCSASKHFEIDLGTTENNFKKKQKCEECGCNMDKT